MERVEEYGMFWYMKFSKGFVRGFGRGLCSES